MLKIGIDWTEMFYGGDSDYFNSLATLRNRVMETRQAAAAASR